MSAIDEVFARCRKEGRAAFIPFLVAGDPDLETTEHLLEALAEGGADIIELGVPFSDPIADGPTIQRASVRALEGGVTLPRILDLVARTRDRLGVPIVLFSYFNPLFRRGLSTFAEQAAASGVDGVLCVDVPPEEAEEELIPVLRARNIDTIFLLAPTSSKARMKKIVKASTGFVYYVSRIGITGEQKALAPTLLQDTRKLRKKVRKPLAVGFGISSPEQVADVADVADAVVVGSALVKLVEDESDAPNLSDLLRERVRELTAPLREAARKTA